METTMTQQGIPVVKLPSVEGMLYALEHSDDDYRAAYMVPNPDANPRNGLTAFKADWQDIGKGDYWKMRERYEYALNYSDHAAGFDYYSYSLDAQQRAAYDAMIDAAELAEIEATQLDASVYGQV